ANTGAAIYNPNASFNGTDSFTFRVSDGQTNSGIATVSLTVTPPVVATNHPPVANNQSVATVEATPKAITLNGSDPDGALSSFLIVTRPALRHAPAIDANTGAAIYTPNASFNGGDSFTFRVTDGQTDSGVATVSLTVTPATTNIPPAGTNVLPGVSVVDYT